MKLDKKYIVLLALVCVVVIASVIALKGGVVEKDTYDFSLSPTPTVSTDASPTVSTDVSPTAAPAVKATASPKPGVIAEDVKDYNYWFRQLDSQNRVIGIYNECAYVIPSNVAHKNNVMVMLDNTRSTQSLILKIGTKEYSLAAQEWILVTLSSPTLPINLPIFCKGIELGQIELQ
ncbi:MAG: hypothetical protein HYT62_03185 [Candidatus Yanofskybacteria bacterium]|nr:hypothetical protein [Candidatus Yanofskybacteria bacterium]